MKLLSFSESEDKRDHPSILLERERDTCPFVRPKTLHEEEKNFQAKKMLDIDIEMNSKNFRAIIQNFPLQQ